MIFPSMTVLLSPFIFITFASTFFGQFFTVWGQYSVFQDIFNGISKDIMLSWMNSFIKNLPEPENPYIALEQLYISPFKVTEDEALTCGQLIVSRGFNYTRYYVTTEDGYIITLYRIRNLYAQSARGSRLKPVLLVHGAVSSCAFWMTNSPDGHVKQWQNGKPPEVVTNNLAFALANREFDVWMGNNRGTSYSRNHTILNPDQDKSFWDTDWNEMGMYDLPAFIDYILEETDHEKLSYIGHSQGTTSNFVLLSEKPEYAEKLELNIQLAPVAFFDAVKGIVSLIPTLPPIDDSLEYILSGPFPPSQPQFDAVLTIVCTIPFIRPFCEAVYFLLFGIDREMLDSKRFPVIVSLIETVPFKSLLHYDQLRRSKDFAKFDYGPKDNLDYYGTLDPPKYNLSNIETKNLILISGLNDFFAIPENVRRLKQALSGKPLVDYVIPYSKFSHTDFLFAKGGYELLNKRIINYLRTYTLKM